MYVCNVCVYSSMCVAKQLGMNYPHTGEGYMFACVYVYVLCIHAGCYPVCWMSAQAMVRGGKPVATPEYVFMCVHVQIYMRMQSHPTLAANSRTGQLSRGATGGEIEK